MSVDDAPGPLISAAKGRQVTLAAAARELSEAWMAADDEARRTRGEGMLRLREVNLIVHVASEADEGPARTAAARFVREHSGRVIILVPPAPSISAPDREAGGSPALISTTCFIDQHSGRQVCSELVVIGATGEEGRAARAAVFGLLVPDLPMLGWWTGGFSQLDPTLLWLGEFSDQLMVDSARIDDRATGGPGVDRGAGIRALAGLAEGDLRTRVRDLAWLRSAPWRSLTAELFDDPERRLLIPRISRLRVEHQGALSQALLYSAWFGSRLGLNVVGDRWREDASGCVALRRDPGFRGEERTPASIVIELQSLGPRDGDAPGLAAVSIYAEPSSTETPPPDLAGEGDGLTGPALPALSMCRRPHSRVCTACVAEGADEVVVKTLEMSPEEDWELLCRVFETPRPDAIFAEAVGLAAALSDTQGDPAPAAS
ncbi:MAG: glucose-6-phosphate dehydrogenase assembly protein OpcA [bacterium]